MDDSWYDTAQICINGHVINSASLKSPVHNTKFCSKCGAPAITKCENCNADIRGQYHHPDIYVADLDPKPPVFCHECGKSYPWTEAKLKAAQELADELDNLTAEERSLLKKSLDDIVRETHQTIVAVTRFKKLVAKAGPVAAEGFKKILWDIAIEFAKRQIWPS